MFTNVIYNHVKYVDDIIKLFIIQLYLQKKNKFKLNFKTNDLHSKLEDVFLFKNQNPKFKSVQEVISGTEIITPPLTVTSSPGTLNENNSFRFGNTNNSIK